MDIGRIQGAPSNTIPKGNVAKRKAALSISMDKVTIGGSTRDEKMQRLQEISNKGGKESFNGYGDNFIGPAVDLGIGIVGGGILGGLGGAALATGVAASLLTGAAGVVVGGAIGFGLAMAYVNKKFHS